MAKREFANAKMERAVPGNPGNPGKQLRNPRVAVVPNRRRAVKKPALDSNWNTAPEINLYGP
jgi:hypothetical protein